MQIIIFLTGQEIFFKNKIFQVSHTLRLMLNKYLLMKLFSLKTTYILQ